MKRTLPSAARSRRSRERPFACGGEVAQGQSSAQSGCQAVSIAHLTLPNRQHRPAHIPETSGVGAVTRDIRAELLDPECYVRLRLIGKSAARMLMPKAAMNEDCGPVT